MKRNWKISHNIQCPRCGSKATEQHDIDLTPWHWYFCRDCGLVWEDKPKGTDNEKA